MNGYFLGTGDVLIICTHVYSPEPNMTRRMPNMPCIVAYRTLEDSIMMMIMMMIDVRHKSIDDMLSYTRMIFRLDITTYNIEAGSIDR